MLPTSGDFSAWPHQPAKVDCHGEHGIGHVLQHAAVAAGTAGTFPGQRRAATAVAIVLALEAILTGPASGKWRLPQILRRSLSSRSFSQMLLSFGTLNKLVRCV